MPEANEFLDLIRQVRSGDDAAARTLVEMYEPAIRRTVRLQLRDSRMRRLLDSMDICQSVMASFFLRAASGQYELETPEQLLKLLVVMARNKLASQSRKAQVVRRKDQIAPGTPGDEAVLAAPEASPSREVAARDLLHMVRNQLSEEERQLADRRAAGQEWVAIAAEIGGTPEALRKKLARALDRAAKQLGLDDLNEE